MSESPSRSRGRVPSPAVPAPVQIIIDPQDPGYAELPGQRYTTASTAWGTATAFWLIAAPLMLLMIPAARSWGRQRRVQRGWVALSRGAAAAAAPTGSRRGRRRR
jgi:hypothetical protein